MVRQGHRQQPFKSAFPRRIIIYPEVIADKAERRNKVCTQASGSQETVFHPTDCAAEDAGNRDIWRFISRPDKQITVAGRGFGDGVAGVVLKPDRALPPEHSLKPPALPHAHPERDVAPSVLAPGAGFNLKLVQGIFKTA